MSTSSHIFCCTRVSFHSTLVLLESKDPPRRCGHAARARTAPELGGFTLLDRLENAERVTVPAAKKPTFLRDKERRAIAGVGGMPKGASTNCDLVRSEGVDHSEQRVRRRVERYKRRWHCLAPVHAVGVFAIAGAAA